MNTEKINEVLKKMVSAYAKSMGTELKGLKITKVAEEYSVDIQLKNTIVSMLMTGNLNQILGILNNEIKVNLQKFE